MNAINICKDLDKNECPVFLYFPLGSKLPDELDKSFFDKIKDIRCPFKFSNERFENITREKNGNERNT